MGEAPWTTRLSVRLHLMMCRHCRRYAAQLREIGAVARKILGRYAAQLSAIAAAARRILGPHGEPEDPETLQRLEKAILEKKPDGGD